MGNWMLTAMSVMLSIRERQDSILRNSGRKRSADYIRNFSGVDELYEADPKEIQSKSKELTDGIQYILNNETKYNWK